MQPSPALKNRVKAKLSEKGTSIFAIIREHDLHKGDTYLAIEGKSNGEKAVIARTIVIKTAFSDREIARYGLDKYIIDLNQTHSSSVQESGLTVPVITVQS